MDFSNQADNLLQDDDILQDMMDGDENSSFAENYNQISERSGEGLSSLFNNSFVLLTFIKIIEIYFWHRRRPDRSRI